MPACSSMGEKDQIDLGLALSRDPHLPPSCFELDLDGDGLSELCLRQGDFFIALQGMHVRAFGRRWLAPLPGRADWIEARGLHLRKYTEGRLDWEVEAEKAAGRMVALEAFEDSIWALFSNGLLWVLDAQGRKNRELSLGWRGIDNALFFADERSGHSLLSAFFPPGR